MSLQLILDEWKKRKKRLDGRDAFEYRKIEVEQGVIDTAEGSAIARMGKTQVIAGVKFDVVEPFPSDPDKGVLITNAELLPLASRKFEPGPPDERSIELARVVDRGIRSAEIIDLSKFFIEEGKVLGLFIDLYVMDYDGNLFDASYLAAISALADTKLPKVEDGSIIRGEYIGNLPLNRLVTSSTFAVFSDNICFLDPAGIEEQAAPSLLTVAVSGEYVVAIQKSGRGTFKKETALKLVDKAFEKHADLIKYVR